eukprot:gnl/MRDRNA2_/MRDRNA2_34392_c0_seq1.p1 gnl/MRDRNA2_/MRDRNA2_34392_c0~~gnl/MRDRNA2_/MRDRNA2_34392_c0_seq1.p1  ORF type:complete len:535 (+),score=146.85 gnl/MRDRNA2_/MRDRNA2_34392_c0_seq1:151-1755(+)
MTSPLSYLHECEEEKVARILKLAAASHDRNLLEGSGDEHFLRRSQAMREEADNARRLADAKGRLDWCNDAISTTHIQNEEMGRETENNCSALKQKVFDFQKQQDQMDLLADAAQVKLQRATADQVDAAHQRKLIEARCETLSKLILEMLDEAEVWRCESKSIWVQRLRKLARHSIEIGIVGHLQSQSMQNMLEPRSTPSKSDEKFKNGSQLKKEKTTRVEMMEEYEEQAALLHKEIRKLREENLSLLAEAKKHCRPCQQPRGALEAARRRLLECARKVKWLEDSCASTRSQLAEQHRYRCKLEEKLLGLGKKLTQLEAASAAQEIVPLTKFTAKELDVQAAALCLQEQAEEQVLAEGTANVLPLRRNKTSPKLLERDFNLHTVLTSGGGGLMPVSVGSSSLTKKIAAEAQQTTQSTTDELQHYEFGDKNWSEEPESTNLGRAESPERTAFLDSFSVPKFFDLPADIDQPENEQGEQEGFGGLFDISGIEALAKQPLELHKGGEQDLPEPCIFSAPFDIGSIEALTAEIEASLGI